MPGKRATGNISSHPFANNEQRQSNSATGTNDHMGFRMVYKQTVAGRRHADSARTCSVRLRANRARAEVTYALAAKSRRATRRSWSQTVLCSKRCEGTGIARLAHEIEAAKETWVAVPGPTCGRVGLHHLVVFLVTQRRQRQQSFALVVVHGQGLKGGKCSWVMLYSIFTSRNIP
jgi:hypothetical protein